MFSAKMSIFESDSDDLWDTSQSVTDPFWFEKFDFPGSRHLTLNLRPYIGFLAVVYLLAVYWGQAWMKNRPAFQLQKSLFIWNLLLSVFSICCAIRMVPQQLTLLLSPNGIFQYSCVRKGNYDAVGVFWGWLFMWSKILELGDTAFIILRKKPLLNLHWFHHVTVLYFSFFLWTDAEPMARIGVMNVIVHSIMYSYYALMALKIRVPKRIAMCLTSIQLLQFVMWLLINFYTVFTRAQGKSCVRTNNSLTIQVSLGLSYLILFANFFYKTYVLNGKKKRL